MTVTDILNELRSLSNPATLKHNKKDGAGDNQYGVKLGDLRKVAAKIKTNHELAMQLWDTGNLDARLIACLTTDPKQLSAGKLDELVRSMDFVQVAEWFISYVLKDNLLAGQFREEWVNSGNKWAARAGWSLTAGRVARKPEGLDISALLDRIEAEMPTAPQEVQWTMNTTLANIGIHHPQYRQRALDIGNKLGIYRDYPVSKGCTSPFAPIWINEMVSRQEKTAKGN